MIEKEPLSVFEKPKLTKQLDELKDMFFIDLNSQFDTYWQMIEDVRNEFDEGITYPNPKELTREFVEKYISDLNPDFSKRSRELRDLYNKNPHFATAVKWASNLNEVYFKNENNGSATARDLFKDENKTKEEIEHITGIINATLRKVTPEKPQSNPYKDLRERIKDDDFLDSVVDYCVDSGIEIKESKFRQRATILYPEIYAKQR